MAGISNTQRTLKYLRDQGYTSAIVEKWNSHTRTRHDLFGIIDIIALDPKNGVIGVQSTGSAFSEHYKKLTEEKATETRQWLETPGTQLVLIGWRKVKKVRGGKVMVWKPRILNITLGMLNAEGTTTDPGTDQSTSGGFALLNPQDIGET